MAVTSDDRARLDLVEHDLKGLKGVVGEVVTGLRDVKEALLQIPKQSSVHVMIKTIGVSVSITIGCMTMANWWLSSQLAPDRQTLSRVEKYTDDISVLRYRIDLLEKQKSP